MLSHLFSTSGLIPLATSIAGQPSLMALFAFSNFLVGVSYTALSAMLVYLMYRTRRDNPFNWVFLAFAAFLVSSAITHFIGVVTLWTPLYWLAAYFRMVTAITSIATAIAFPYIIPQTLTLVKTAKLADERKNKLEQANVELEALYSKQVEIDRIKSTFFAGISHELRTPLTLLLGPIQHMLNDSTLTAEQRTVLTVAERNGQLLEQYIDDLLDVSRLQTGQSSLKYTVLDLAVQARIIAGYFEIVAEQRKIHFSIDTPLSLIIEADSEKVERIILNLLYYAFKFVSNEGKIRCSLSTKEGHVTIRVEDNGPRVKPGLSEISYERFEASAPDTASGDRSSSGLGLAIAREFTFLHSGTFTVSNTSDGPYFEITLPLSAPAGIKVQKEMAPSADPDDMTWHRIASLLADNRVEETTEQPSTTPHIDQPLILVVEDNVDMNRFISLALALDYRVESAYDGQEGLQKALELKPDLIISDLMMPLMNGEELIHQLQIYPDTALIPVILLTARANSDLRVRLLREGAKDYLVKPFSVEELGARIDNLILQKRAHDALEDALVSQEQDVVLLSDEISQRTLQLETTLHDLQISRSRFRRLAESNIIGIVTVKHPERLLTEANDAFLNMIGYTRDDLSRGNIYLGNLTPPEYTEADAKAITEAEQTGVASPWTKEYIRKDGSRIPVMIGYALLDGQSDTSVGFVVDLTERRQSEEAQRFLTDASSVLASSLDATTTLESLCNLIVPRYADRCIIDLVDGNRKTSRITVKDIKPSNEPLAYQVQQARSAELVVQPRGITWTLHTGESQFYPEVLESDLHLHMEDEDSLNILRQLRISSQIIVPLIARGRTLGAMSLVYTTSGRHYSHADLVLMEDLGRRTALAVDNARLYEESQQAIRMRDEFLSVAAHELKTPVTSLRGFAQVTLRQVEKNNDFDLERVRRAFINMDQQSEKLARLVTQLLSIARIQAGRLILDREKTDFVRLVEDVVTAAQMRTAKHLVALHAPITLPIFCDPLRLEQVITNLVDNAIKYSPDGGDIDIEITQSELNRVSFIITDHGIGVAPEHREKIFQRFYQAQKRTYLEGMGLGLYISHEIVVLHGGTIQVEQPPVGGTRFIVSLPVGLGDESSN